MDLKKKLVDRLCKSCKHFVKEVKTFETQGKLIPLDINVFLRE